MDIPDAVTSLQRDLQGIFGARLRSLVVYGLEAHRSGHDPLRETHAAHGRERMLTHTLAVADALSTDDLRACTARVAAWHEAGLATPLLVAAHEFERSLDVFPFEFGAILSDHRVVAGDNPFEGLAVDSADLRRACEVQARGHLLHLREGYLETHGRSDRLAVLIVDSAPAFATLVANLGRLGDAPGDVHAAARHFEQRLGLPDTTVSSVVALAGVQEIPSAEADKLFPPYLDAVRRIVEYVDTWQ